MSIQTFFDLPKKTVKMQSKALKPRGFPL